MSLELKHCPILIAIALAAFLVLPSISLATEVLIFAIIALGCSILLGYAGLLSFGQAIFFGLGAYVASLSQIHLGVNFLVGLLIATAAGAIVAALVGALAIRRQGIYFVMLTLAFTQLAFFISYTLDEWTGGDNGLLDVPRNSVNIFGYEIAIDSSEKFYAFVAISFVLIFLALLRITHSQFGRTLLAIKQNEERATALGYSVKWYKVLAFVFSGSITAYAGGMYALFLNFAPLSNVELIMSEHILIMAIIGGTGNVYGAVLGSLFLVVVGDMLSAFWERWLFMLGGILILTVFYMRGGLISGLYGVFEFLSQKLGSASTQKES
ncbi:branched-chain amino acid ABC transporter permease [Leisingera sp. SS27]|uniref:branched-chain amino acid ABC transporter permease n=1 Tax=Leisingera sp. SS27 TaxID=2979462 RepID=UPI002330FA86|nr:branched-chain amino acid ABC transporter permease [Leisingera sp. SS27]MDC0659385.1 branched-chain amino acid ABC transporter permease [Leisingera sp. SS27]